MEAFNDIFLEENKNTLVVKQNSKECERCYKKAMSPSEAFKIIKEESGSHFDPKLVEVFLKHKNEFRI